MRTIKDIKLSFWIGNKKPGLIWDNLILFFYDRKLTYQQFLELLKLREDLIILYELGKISIQDYCDEIHSMVDGELGVAIRRGDIK